jgi:hypothetical protein
LGGSSVVCLLSLVCLGELAETRGAEAIITADVYTKSHAFVKAVYPTLSGRGLVFMVAADRWRELDDSVPRY